jgi:hypothetical protein
MIVRPLGKIHFCAVLGGNAIVGNGSGDAAFKLAMANNKTDATSFDTWMRCITETFKVVSVIKAQ